MAVLLNLIQYRICIENFLQTSYGLLLFLLLANILLLAKRKLVGQSLEALARKLKKVKPLFKLTQAEAPP
jgi:hypothetical protein